MLEYRALPVAEGRRDEPEEPQTTSSRFLSAILIAAAVRAASFP